MSSKKIIFERPDLRKLRKEGYMCIDMHFHSTYSDGAATVPQILEKARKLGIGVSITDHNEIEGVVEAYRTKKEKDIVLPGIEVKTNEGVDALFYFSDIEELKKFYALEIFMKKKSFKHSTKTTIPLKRLLEISANYDCLISAAHPFGYALRNMRSDMFSAYRELFDKIDVFEAINGGNKRTENITAIEYIEKHSKGFTGGSDGHSIYPLGKIVTCSKVKNFKSFLASIRSRKSIVIGMDSKLGKISEYAKFGLNKLANLLKK